MTLSGPDGRIGIVWIYLNEKNAKLKSVKYISSDGKTQTLNDFASAWKSKERVLQLDVPVSPDGTKVSVAF